MTSLAAIFDLDGTLVDAFADITAAMNHPLKARGYPTHSVETISTFVGDGAGKLIDRSVPPGLDKEEIEVIKTEMFAYYREHCADTAVVYPDIKECLQELIDHGVKLAVLSNKPHPMTMKTCEKLGITRYFEDIAGEDGDRIPRKPNPKGLIDQIDRLSVEKAVYIGDGVPDGQVSNAADVPFIAVTWGTRTADELALFEPIATLDSPKDLAGSIIEAFGLSEISKP